MLSLNLPSPGVIALKIRDTLLFSACYLLLDWTSYIYPLGPFNITPWNPAPALSVVWMTLGGLRYSPLIYVITFLSDIFIRHAPGGVIVSGVTSMILAAGYSAIAAGFRHFLKPDYRLSRSEERRGGQKCRSRWFASH